ncbi:unnamed protein product [Orchesella dallaii]|uniref:Odorant receptor n=1 Tax=Orchesella dallaii TaxID=48710 RepID=A0ABP1QZB9_9HEXA
MGFGEAFINVQLIYQRIFDMPWYYDTNKEKLIPNPKVRNRWKMPIWQFMKIGLVLGSIACIYRCVRIFKKYQATGGFESEEVCLYFMALAMLTQAFVTIYTLEVDPKQLCYINSQIFKLGGIKYQGWPSSKRLPNLMELVGYGMALGFCNFTIVSAFYPVLRPYDPINMELDGILPEVPRRLLAAIFYGTLVFFAANTCASFLLMVLAIVHVFEEETEANHKLSMEESQQKTRHLVERVIQEILKVLFLLLEKVFRKNKVTVHPELLQPTPPYLQEIMVVKRTSEGDISVNILSSQTPINERFRIRRKRHIRMRLLMETSNKSCETFVPTMAIVGMVICVVFNYTLLTMYDKEDLQLFVALGVCILICINLLILFLCHHASLPLIHTTETIIFWKGRLTGQVEKRQVRCMRPLGFTLGKFFYAKRDTALEINDIISNATITLLLG